jgi:hypothetical protein
MLFIFEKMSKKAGEIQKKGNSLTTASDGILSAQKPKKMPARSRQYI